MIMAMKMMMMMTYWHLGIVSDVVFDADAVVVVVDDDDDVGVVEVIGEEDGKPLNKAKVGQHHGHVDRTASIRFRSLAKTNLSCSEAQKPR